MEIERGNIWVATPPTNPAKDEEESLFFHVRPFSISLAECDRWSIIKMGGNFKDGSVNLWRAFCTSL